MTTYFVEYPRDFANEYTVYAVNPADAAGLVAAFPDALQIPRADAIRLGWTRPRQAKLDGETWYGGFAGGACTTYPTTLADAIDSARAATLEMLSTLVA